MKLGRKHRLLLFALFASTVLWVSYTRPLSLLFGFLHTEDDLLHTAQDRNQRRLAQAQEYFRGLPKRDPAQNDLLHGTTSWKGKQDPAQKDQLHGTKWKGKQDPANNDLLHDRASWKGKQDLVHNELLHDRAGWKDKQDPAYNDLLHDRAGWKDMQDPAQNDLLHGTSWKGKQDLAHNDLLHDRAGRKGKRDPAQNDLLHGTKWKGKQNLAYNDLLHDRAGWKDKQDPTQNELLRDTTRKGKQNSVQNDLLHGSSWKGKQDSVQNDLLHGTSWKGKQDPAHNDLLHDRAGWKGKQGPAQNELLHHRRKDWGPVKFVVVVLTVRRPSSPGYVVQSTALLHAETRVEGGILNGSFLFVCNVDGRPDKHEHAAFLKDYIPYVELHGKSSLNGTTGLNSPNTNIPYRDTLHANVKMKNRWDYMFCLQSAMALAPASDYVMVVEDDAVALPGMSVVLKEILNRIGDPETFRDSERTSNEITFPCSAMAAVTKFFFDTPCVEHPPNVTKTFAFLKLYLPEKWRGFYLYDLWRLLDLISFVAVGTGIFLVLHWLTNHTFYPERGGCQTVGRHIQKWSQCHLENASTTVTRRTFLLGAALSLSVCLLVGRVNLNELRRVSSQLYRIQPASGCCTQAMVYPADVVHALVTWLADSPVDKIGDMRIDGLKGHVRRAGYAVEPVLFRHVGMSSSFHHAWGVEEFLMA